MSFKTKATPVQPTPAPLQGEVAPPSARRRRLGAGGVQSTFLGGAAQSALPAPGPTLTGVGGS